MQPVAILKETAAIEQLQSRLREMEDDRTLSFAYAHNHWLQQANRPAADPLVPSAHSEPKFDRRSELDWGGKGIALFGIGLTLFAILSAIDKQGSKGPLRETDSKDSDLESASPGPSPEFARRHA